MNRWTAILEGTRLSYRFELEKGCGMKWHLHPPEDEHAILVERGKAKVEIENQGTFILDANERMDPPKEVKHQVTAMEDNTVIIHTRYAPFTETLAGWAGEVSNPHIEEH